MKEQKTRIHQHITKSKNKEQNKQTHVDYKNTNKENKQHSKKIKRTKTNIRNQDQENKLVDKPTVVFALRSLARVLCSRISETYCLYPGLATTRTQAPYSHFHCVRLLHEAEVGENGQGRRHGLQPATAIYLLLFSECRR